MENYISINNESNSYIPTANTSTPSTSSTDSTSSTEASRFDFNCNVLAILVEAITSLSNTDAKLISVQAEAVLQITNVEASLSTKMMGDLNQIDSDMEYLIKNGDLTSQTVQDQMQELNADSECLTTQFNADNSTLQAMSEKSASCMQLELSSMKTLLSSLGGSVSQFDEFFASQLAK